MDELDRELDEMAEAMLRAGYGEQSLVYRDVIVSSTDDAAAYAVEALRVHRSRTNSTGPR